MGFLKGPIPRQLAAICKFIYARGMVTSSGGNVSMREGEIIYITPTGKSLGFLTPKMVVSVNLYGEIQSEEKKPSKELSLHLSIYRICPEDKVILHLHSPYATALSTLADPGQDVLPALVPGFVARVGCLPMVHYIHPGNLGKSKELIDFCAQHQAVLLQNHGIVVHGQEVMETLNIAEEVEECAHLYLISGGKGHPLSEKKVKELRDRFKKGGEESHDVA